MSLIIEDNFNDIYTKIAIELLRSPEYKSTNRHGETLYEFLNFGWTLTNPVNCFATARPMSLKYLQGEMDFYLSGSPYLKDISKHSSFWNKVSDDGRVINSNYGQLLLHKRNVSNYTQFEYAKECLLKNLDSKKAVMTVYDSDHSRVSNDNPCTMFLQFFVREKKVHLLVFMRSSDVWFGLPYDVPFFVSLQWLMLKSLQESGFKDLTLGEYTHRSNSLHLYERNLASIEEGVGRGISPLYAKDQTEMFQQYIIDPLIKGGWYGKPD